MTTRKRLPKLAKLKPSRTTRSSSKKQSVIASKAGAFDPGTKPASKFAGAKASKKETVLGMLRQPDGTSLAAIMAVTGWQEHSVRSFFATVVKKTLKFNLISRKVDGDRIYRIENADAASI
jgi:Protein of unknown function (DUF3489)